MNTSAVKSFAIWARRELLARVSQRAELFGITATSLDDKAAAANGHVFTKAEAAQRRSLISRINEQGYDATIDEAAYTWFNRLIALRFMEVNGYLHVRVFTDETGAFRPQILAEAIHLELPGLDRELVWRLKDANRTEELYRYLLITQCNALGAVLPRMFERIADYTELLLPDNLLREGSVIHELLSIPEDDFRDHVQIIGWLYQYYNTEPKDKVFANLKKNIKIEAKDIPAATQLFTPDWIVRYMVENSLGRLWIEGHPNPELRATWRYYIDDAEQEPEVQAKLDALCREEAKLRPQDILCVDPCCGSGHIVVYMFDVLMQIYESQGWTRPDAVRSIIENNLYALDIDGRMAQLAYFAIMMKAREYDGQFFERSDIPQPKVYTIPQSEPLTDAVKRLPGDVVSLAELLVADFAQGKTLGSLIVPSLSIEELKSLRVHFELNSEIEWLLPLIDVAGVLLKRYNVVCTNPPYMGTGGMCKVLSDYLKNNFPDSKADVFAAFMEACRLLCKSNAFMSMITPQAWMFLKRFKTLREKIIGNGAIHNMIYLGKGSFGFPDFGLTAFVVRNGKIHGYKGTYYHLAARDNPAWKEQAFLAHNCRYVANQDDFHDLPGSPVAFWASSAVRAAFNNKCIKDIEPPRSGLSTADNNRFVRAWWETDSSKFAMPQGSIDDIQYDKKWYPYNNGGGYRKWYGNNYEVVNWENDGSEILSFEKSTVRNKEFYFRAGITWSSISSDKISARAFNCGYLFSTAGFCIFGGQAVDYMMALMNSKVGYALLKILSPTVNFNVGSIAKLPVYPACIGNENIIELTQGCVSHSHADWDAFETSWDFARHPLLSYGCDTIAAAFDLWRQDCDARFARLKANEEELNRIFIDIYGLQSEISPEVDDRDVTVRRADLGRDIRSLLSYFIGCCFGRYSIDADGLAYAGGEWDGGKYRRFIPVADNTVILSCNSCHTNDVIALLCEFLSVAFAPDKLEQNLVFIVNALGGSGSPREVIRSYFKNDFFDDHCYVYRKRPIYWHFDSNDNKYLMYAHRCKSIDLDDGVIANYNKVQADDHHRI